MARIRRRRRRKNNLRPLTENVNGEDQSNGAKAQDESTWSSLPIDLLPLIASRLELENNIRFGGVCKRWYDAATSVRVEDRPPWLMFFPKHGNLYEFYDPSRRKIHTLELPGFISGSKVCHSRDGWLLLSKPSPRQVVSFISPEEKVQDLFFFNPFTRELKNAPRIEISLQIVAFSSPPTLDTFSVFAVSGLSQSLALMTARRHSSELTEWTNEYFYSETITKEWQGIVFCNDVLSSSGRLGVFNPTSKAWHILAVQTPICPVPLSRNAVWKPKMMAKHEGDIFVMYAYGNENLVVYKLDFPRRLWVEKNDLDGSTLFASSLSCESRNNLPGMTKNRVYFSKIRSYGRRCLSYKVDEGRYYPSKNSHDWDDQSPFESIWIQTPSNVLEIVQ